MKTHLRIRLIILTMILLAACGQKQTALPPTNTPPATAALQPTAPVQPTSASTEAPAISADRIAAAQEFVDLLVQGDYAAAEEKLDATMKAAQQAGGVVGQPAKTGRSLSTADRGTDQPRAGL
jgi:predicted small lipoprotein YifL